MKSAERLTNETRVLVFDQYGTIVDMQRGLTEAVTPFLRDKGWSGEIRGRYVNGYPVNSGAYFSPIRPDGSREPLDSYGLLDALVVWRPKFSEGLVISLIVENALNNHYATFIGVPRLGRLVMTKLQYTFRDPVGGGSGPRRASVSRSS